MKLISIMFLLPLLWVAVYFFKQPEILTGQAIISYVLVFEAGMAAAVWIMTI